MIGLLVVFWALALGIGGIWWMAQNHQEFGMRTFWGLLPWSRGVLIGGLLFGLADGAWLTLAAFIPIAILPGLGVPDSKGRYIGPRVPGWLGSTSHLMGEGASIAVCLLAVYGLLAGAPVGWESAQWLFAESNAGLLSVYFGEGKDPARAWQVVSAALGIAAVYYSHALARKMRQDGPETEEEPAAS